MAKDELDDIEWLSICTDRERAAIRRHADLVDVRPGTVLFERGRPARWFYARGDGPVALRATARNSVASSAGEPINELEVLRNEWRAPPSTSTPTSGLCHGPPRVPRACSTRRPAWPGACLCGTSRPSGRSGPPPRPRACAARRKSPRGRAVRAAAGTLPPHAPLSLCALVARRSSLAVRGLRRRWRRPTPPIARS